MKLMFRSGGALLLACGLLTVLGHDAPRESTSPTSTPSAFAGLRLPFAPNHGQFDPRVAYFARTFAGGVFVTERGELVYSLPTHRAGGWALVERFVDGAPRPTSAAAAAAHASYFIGNDAARWHSQVATYTQVSLGEVWPGIAVDLAAHGDNVEKIFTVAPYASVSDIRLRIDGADGVSLAGDGSLALSTGIGTVALTAPIAWQEKNGARHAIDVAYALHDREYGFVLGDHDPSLPVVIDPLLQSTYLGGAAADHPLAMAIHPGTGEVYVAGRSLSAVFPGTAGGAQPAFAGGTADAFVARLSADLTTLLQATYLGGNANQEQAQSLLIHPLTGEVYVAGETFSNNFPGTVGGAQAAYGGGLRDAFVARLSADLTTLLQASYLGGADQDGGYSIAHHPVSGEIYVAGLTDSLNFPATAGGAQPTNSSTLGSQEAFVARLNPALTVLNQSTYYGSFANEEVSNSLAVHPATGEVYIAGQTDFAAPLPGTAGGAQATFGGGGADFFIVRFSADLATIAQATFLGGSDTDGMGTYTFGDGVGRSLAIHATTGDIYVAGFTGSANFPGTAGGAQTARAGMVDAFIARLNANLTTLTQATYLGGLNGDSINSLLVHPLNGEVYVAGTTAFSGFPASAGGAAAFGGGVNDGFVARLNAGLTALNQSTYFGGSGDEAAGAGLAVNTASGDVYLLGRTPSVNIPAAAGGAQAANGGGQDAFVARITADLQAAPVAADLAIALTAAPDLVFVGGTLTYTGAVTNNGPATATGITLTDTLPVGVTLVSATASQGSCSGTTTIACNLGTLANGANATVTIVVTPNVVGAVANTASVAGATTDGATGNNTATVNTMVAAASADLVLRIDASADPVGVNGELTYAVTVTNNGPADATGVTVSSNLSGTDFVVTAISPSQGSCSGTTTAVCAFGAIARGGVATLDIRATPTRSGTLTLVASASGSEADANAADNSAQRAVNVTNTACSNTARGAAHARDTHGCALAVGGRGGTGGGGLVDVAALLMLLLVSVFVRARASDHTGRSVRRR